MGVFHAACWFCLLTLTGARAGEPSTIDSPAPALPAKEGVEFKTMPVIRTDEGKTRIEFEVNKPTDVTIDTNEIKTPDGNVGQGYAAEYGSVLKFGRDGGKARVLKPGELPAAGERVLLEDAGQRRFAVTGLKGLTDMSIVPTAKASPGSVNRCWCIRSIYDIDLYDRLIVPDYCAFNVKVLDANFNLIAKFGGYDNVDNPGGVAGAPGPEIPITTPPGGNPVENPMMRVTATDAAFYVNDYRIIRSVPFYAAESFARVE